jgi:hypothetical protein
MSKVVAVLCAAAVAAAPWFVDPITVKVMKDRRAPFASSQKTIDLAAQRGECERAQIWAWSDQDAEDVQVTFAELSTADGAKFAPSSWSYKQQGYVNASTSTHYTCIHDILTGDTPPPKNVSCSDTPWLQCQTGCSPTNSTQCSDTNGPKPSPGATCNKCKCNYDHTPCPWHPGDGHPCLSGWYPDPLLDVPATGIPFIPKGFTQPIFVEVCVPYGTTPGNYSGTFAVTSASDTSDLSGGGANGGSGGGDGGGNIGGGGGGAFSFAVPVSLEVWPIDLPRLNDSHAFNTAFTFASTEPSSTGNLRSWYPHLTEQQIWDAWMPFLSKHRVPGDMLYLNEPRPVAEYQALAASGAKWMNLLDAGTPSPPPGCVCFTCVVVCMRAPVGR